MEFIVRHLSSHGFTDIVANTSHLGHIIEEYFGDGNRFGVNFSYSREGCLRNKKWVPSALGSAGGMLRVQEQKNFFDDDFVVLCGDAIIDVDLTKAMELHRKHSGIATVILKQVSNEEVSQYGVVVTDSEGQILSFQEKPAPEEAKSNRINTGIYIFSPEIFNHIPSDCEYDIGSQLFPLLVENNIPFYGVELPMQWIDIGKASDLWNATAMAFAGQIQSFKLPGREVRPGVWVEKGVYLDANAEIEGPIYIGEGSVINQGVVLRGPTVIHAGCFIESGAEIEESIIWSNTRISGQAYLRKRVIFGPHCINPDGSFIDLNAGGFDWLVCSTQTQLSTNPDFPELLMQEVQYEA
jgi:mannose-1-phosphate guanylyltransferase